MPSQDATKERPRLSRALLFALALHALLAVRLETESGSYWTALLRPTPDLPIVFACAFAVLWLTRGPRLAALTFGLLALLWVGLRGGSSFTERVYARRFDLYDDLELVPGLLHMFLHELPRWQQIGAVVGIVLLLALAVWILARLARPIFTAPKRRAHAALGLAVSLLLACGALAWMPAPEAETGREMAFAKEARFGVLPRYAIQIVQIPAKRREVEAFSQRLTEVAKDAWRHPRDLGRLKGADVHVYFIESLGRSLTRLPRTAEAFEGWLSELERTAGAAGFQAVSSFIAPSVTGGMSSLAHAELLSGVEIPTRRLFMRLINSKLKPLPHAFLAAGYRTADVQPAMYVPWPIGMAMFGFSDPLFLNELNYEGTTYPWGTMPDQFALARFLQLRPQFLDVPIFSMFVSVTSHVPFSMIPPYFADWNAALEPGAFDVEPAERFDIDFHTFMGHADAERAYLAALEYSFRVLGGFCEQLERPSLVLVLGDHQPPDLGELHAVDSSFDVPILALANDPALLEPLRELGFVDGYLGPPDHPSMPSYEFLNRFLAATSGAEGE